MCGPHPLDISTLRPKLVLPTEFEPIHGWSESTLGAAIAYLGHLFGGYISKLLDEHADKMTSYARAFAESSLGEGLRGESAGMEYSHVLGPAPNSGSGAR